MVDARLAIIEDHPGTASATCRECGALFSLTIPSDDSAVSALEEMFDKHLANRHQGRLRTMVKKVNCVLWGGTAVLF